jgi:prepilin-type N-terminal cleavage/methylation domain-containing protein
LSHGVDGRVDKGFTLLEMVIAVFIISVMIAVVMPHLMGAGKRAQAVACEQNQRMIRAALAQYDLLYHTYPAGTTMEQLQALKDAELLQSIPTEPNGGHYIIHDSGVNDVEVTCDVHGTLGE